MAVQLPPLSSIHWPASFCRTTKLCMSVLTGFSGFMGGWKPVPAFGTGRSPPYGPEGLATSLGTMVPGPLFCGDEKPLAMKALPGTTVVRLPLSKKAT